ncbi:hypothetical protein HOE04_01565 [archaeon]|jgi:hypothetical protein|nr:hypothetical protein [archaeon]
MVNQKVLIRDKFRKHKKISKVLLTLTIITIIIIAIFLIGFFSKKSTNQITIENPLKDIVFANTNAEGLVDKQKVIEQATIEFNQEYINYLLIALGVNNLHKSLIGYGNPVVEFAIENEIWSSEITNNNLQTTKAASTDKDLTISISKQEAIEALLSPDIETFMKTSVTNHNTEIEMVANKVELASKGYLAMYKEITGEEISVDE